MYFRKKIRGKPYTFQEFVFFSPKQFDRPVELEEKKFLFRIKICTNSNRTFSGPFIEEVIGEYEISNKELKKMLEIVNETPGLIIYGFEYTRTDDMNGLWKYYGNDSDKPLPLIQHEEMAQ